MEKEFRYLHPSSHGHHAAQDAQSHHLQLGQVYSQPLYGAGERGEEREGEISLSVLFFSSSHQLTGELTVFVLNRLK